MPPGKTGIAPVARYTPTPTRAAKGKGKVPVPASATASPNAASATASTSATPSNDAAVVAQAASSTVAAPSVATASSAGSRPATPSGMKPNVVNDNGKGEGKGKGKGKAKSVDIDKEEGEISDSEHVTVQARTASNTRTTLVKGLPPRPGPPGKPVNVASVSSYRPEPATKAARPVQPGKNAQTENKAVSAQPVAKAAPTPGAARPGAASAAVPVAMPGGSSKAASQEVYDRENKYEYQFVHGRPPPAKKKGRGKAQGRSQAAATGVKERSGPQHAQAALSSTSSVQSNKTAVSSTSTQRSASTVTGLPDATQATLALPNAPEAGPSRPSDPPTAANHISSRVLPEIPLAPRDDTPASLRAYFDKLKHLLKTGVTDQMLLERGVDPKYVSGVCEEIRWASQQRAQRKKEAELWTQPREKRELSDDASHGGLTPMALTQPTVESGMDVDVDAEEAADEQGPTGGGAYARSTADMVRTLSETTDNSEAEEWQVERMMVVASPEAPRPLPLMQGPSSQLASPQQIKQPQYQQPLRLAASSSWTPTVPTGPRSLQSKGPSVSNGPAISASLPARPSTPVQAQAAAGQASSVIPNTVPTKSATSAAELKARLLAGRAASSSSPSTNLIVKATTTPLPHSAPTPTAAPLNPLAVPFTTPAPAIPILSPVPVLASASAPAKAPSRDMTAALQARTAMLDARRKALESMRLKRQEVQHQLDDAATAVAAPANSDTSLDAKDNAGIAEHRGTSGEPDSSVMVNGRDEQMETELENLKADLDTMVKEAEEMGSRSAEETKDAALPAAEAPTSVTLKDEHSQMDIDAEPEEGEIEDTSPPPTRALTPSLINPPAPAASNAYAPSNRRKRPNAMDFDNQPSHTSGRHPYKRRFGVPALPIPILIAQEKRRLQFTLDDEDAGDDSSDDDGERKRLGTGTPIPEIKIPDEYDPKKQLLEHEEKIEALKRLIAEKKMKADAKAMAERVRLRKAEAKAAAGEDVIESKLASAQMSRAVSNGQAIAEGADRAAKTAVSALEIDESGMDVDVPEVINNKDEPKAEERRQEAVGDADRVRRVLLRISIDEQAASSTSRFQAYKPILPLYPGLTRQTNPSSDPGAPVLDTGLLSQIVLTRRLNAEPDLLICAAEVGGGACADAGCEDLHLGRQPPITEDDLIQYASHFFPKHSTKVVRTAVKQIVKATQERERDSGAMPITTAKRGHAATASSVQGEKERDGLMQALAQVVSLLSSLPPAASAGTA